MLQQGGVALVESASFGFPQLVGGRREVVAADHPGHRAQVPQRTLQPFLQGFIEPALSPPKGLSKGQVYKPPPRVAKDELEEAVSERLAGDSDPQFAGVCEIQLGFPAGWMYLGKEHLLFRTMQGTPVPKTALEAPELGRTELSRVAFFQPFQDGSGLEGPFWVPPQQGFDGFTPDRSEGIRPGPPGSRRLPFRGQWPPLPGTGRTDAHSSGRRRYLLSFTFHKLLPQSTYLLSLDHPHTPNNDSGEWSPISSG